MRLPAILLATAALSGCAVGPNYQPAKLALTPAFMGSAAIAPDQTDAAFWQGFGDPVLADLVAKALAANLDIDAAARPARPVARGCAESGRGPAAPHRRHGRC